MPFYCTAATAPTPTLTKTAASIWRIRLFSITQSGRRNGCAKARCVPGGFVPPQLKKLKAKELDEDDIDQQMAMIAGLVEAAQNGDAACANVIVKLLGEALPGTDSTDELEKAAEILGGVESVIE